MLKAVLFDMDDTLVDWSARTEDWATIGLRTLRPVRAYLIRAGHTVPTLEQMVERMREAAIAAWDSAAAPEFPAPRQHEILRRMLAETGIDPAQVNMEAVLEAYAWDLVPGVQPFADTIPLLESLRSANLQTGLLTNAAQPMWMRDRELEKLGLLHYFDVRLTAGDVGRVKPHPAPFEALLNGLGVSADEAVFVGDRPQDDVAGAHAVGMRAVWVRRGTAHNGVLRQGIRPNAVIDRLSDLLNVFDIWYPGWRERGQ